MTHYEEGFRVKVKYDVKNAIARGNGDVTFTLFIDDKHTFNGLAFLVPTTKDNVPFFAKGTINLSPVDRTDKSDSPHPITYTPLEFPNHAIRRELRSLGYAI